MNVLLAANKERRVYLYIYMFWGDIMYTLTGALCRFKGPRWQQNTKKIITGALMMNNTAEINRESEWESRFALSTCIHAGVIIYLCWLRSLHVISRLLYFLVWCSFARVGHFRLVALFAQVWPSCKLEPTTWTQPSSTALFCACLLATYKTS